MAANLIAMTVGGIQKVKTKMINNNLHNKCPRLKKNVPNLQREIKAIL